MRIGLSPLTGTRKKFKGIFVRIGKKINYKGYSEETILVTNVIDVMTGEAVTDHLWFSFSKGFQDAGLKEGKEGCTIEFEARVKEYQKGYVNRALGKTMKTRDVKLSNPTKVSIIP